MDGASTKASLGKSRQKRKGGARLIHGWRMGVALCGATAGAVFLINVILTVWASVKFGLVGGIGTIQQGSCQRTKHLSLWLHLAINLLSTLLLGASNYSMQVLASPTREEINRAHSQRIWLDIGVPSVRNLRRIAPRRIILWSILAVSGIPLHLLYNSAVFSTLATQEYSVYIATPDLASGAPLNWSSPVVTIDEENVTLKAFQNVSSWEKLENSACIEAYAQPFVSAHKDVVAITSDLNSSVPIIGDDTETNNNEQPLYSSGIAYGWICGVNSRYYNPNGACETSAILKSPGDWQLQDNYGGIHTIQSCMSQPIEEHCQVQFSIVIMAIVIVCNFLKMLCMFLALWRQKSQPLVTLGDAVETFLRHPDPLTEGFCLAGKDMFKTQRWIQNPIKWKEERHRWFSGASVKRWLTCNVL